MIGEPTHEAKELNGEKIIKGYYIFDKFTKKHYINDGMFTKSRYRACEVHFIEIDPATIKSINLDDSIITTDRKKQDENDEPLL